MIFDLRVSDLKLVEKFLITLREMKDDNTQRKIILISDIMTWGEECQQQPKDDSKAEKETYCMIEPLMRNLETRLKIFNLGLKEKNFSRNIFSKPKIVRRKLRRSRNRRSVSTMSTLR